MSENRLMDLKIYMKEMILVNEMLKKKMLLGLCDEKELCVRNIKFKKREKKRYHTDHQEHIDQKLVLC